MDIDTVSLLLGAAAGVLVTGGVLGTLLLRAESSRAAMAKDLEHERAGREELGNLFSLTAQEALEKNNEQFLQRFSELAQEKMVQAKNNSAHDLEKRQLAIIELISPIKKQLEMMGSALEQVKGTDMALRDDLQRLGKETAKLVGALKDPAAQGRWGEFILEGILDKSGLMKGVHYETQVSIQSGDSRMRPDAVIHMHDGFHIVVDAKAPLNEFAEKMADNISAEELQALMQNLAKQVREHIKALGKKNYWETMESADFTVMFLPSEHLFSVALQADPDLVDFAAKNNIVIASPTLLLSLLRVVGLSWRQVELAKNAQEISVRGAELYKRLTAFGSHLEKVGKGINSAMTSYNQAIGSLDRMVMPAARKLSELQSSKEEMPPLEQLENMPRKLEAEDFSKTADDNGDDDAKSKKAANA